jgi:hypothetical protein
VLVSLLDLRVTTFSVAPSIPRWRVHWVPRTGTVVASDHPVLQRWTDLSEREAACRIDPGDVFLVDPDHRVDARLTLYLTRSSFARLARETRRNYAEDSCLFFNFLWSRGKGQWRFFRVFLVVGVSRGAG